MSALTDLLLLATVALVVIALVGDELVRVVDAVALPLGVLLVLSILARLVWFYTSRW